MSKEDILVIFVLMILLQAHLTNMSSIIINGSASSNLTIASQSGKRHVSNTEIGVAIAGGAVGTFVGIGALLACCFGCLSGDGAVQLASGQFKTVAELKYGDMVMAVSPTTQKIVETEVIMDLHRSELTPTLFTVIEAWGGQRISVTPKHLIAVSSGTGAPIRFIYAEDVTPTDYIFLRDGHNQLQIAAVKNISNEVKIGFYNPITMEGTIIVNNVTVSVYAHIKSHDLAHHGLAFHRLYHKLARSLGFAKPMFAPAKSNGQLQWTTDMFYQISKALVPQLFS